MGRSGIGALGFLQYGLRMGLDCLEAAHQLAQLHFQNHNQFTRGGGDSQSLPPNATARRAPVPDHGTLHPGSGERWRCSMRKERVVTQNRARPTHRTNVYGGEQCCCEPLCPVLGRPAQDPVLGAFCAGTLAQPSASAAQRQRRLSVLGVFCAGISAQPSASAEIPSASAAIPSASAAQRQRRPSAGAGAVLVLGCAGARLCWDNLAQEHQHLVRYTPPLVGAAKKSWGAYRTKI